MLAIADINVSQDMNKAALTAISGCGYWLNGRAASKFISTGSWSGYKMVSRGRSQHNHQLRRARHLAVHGRSPGAFAATRGQAGEFDLEMQRFTWQHLPTELHLVDAAEERDLLGLFEKGIDLYLKMEWDEAISFFEKASKLERIPDGPTSPSKVYMKDVGDLRKPLPYRPEKSGTEYFA